MSKVRIGLLLMAVSPVGTAPPVRAEDWTRGLGVGLGIQYGATYFGDSAFSDYV